MFVCLFHGQFKLFRVTIAALSTIICYKQFKYMSKTLIFLLDETDTAQQLRQWRSLRHIKDTICW